MRVVSILFSTMMLARRNSFFLRAYAFATIAPPSSSIEASSPAAHSSRLFASTDLSERTSPSKSSSDGPSLVEKYLWITGPSKLKSFGGLSYVETPEALQRVVFVLGGPGSGKVSCGIKILHRGRSKNLLLLIEHLGIIDYNFSFLGNTKRLDS